MNENNQKLDSVEESQVPEELVNHLLIDPSEEVEAETETPVIDAEPADGPQNRVAKSHSRNVANWLPIALFFLVVLLVYGVLREEHKTETTDLFISAGSSSIAQGGISGDATNETGNDAGSTSQFSGISGDATNETGNDTSSTSSILGDATNETGNDASSTSTEAEDGVSTILKNTEFALPDETKVTLPSLIDGAPVVSPDKKRLTVAIPNMELEYVFAELTETPPADLLTKFADTRVREIITSAGASDIIASPMYNNADTYIRTLSYLQDGKEVREEVLSVLKLSDKYYGTVRFTSYYDNVASAEMTEEQKSQLDKIQSVLSALFGIR